MTEQIPMSVLEQLRSYDGKLFQNEAILSFYTDIKQFVWTQVSSTLRTSENVEDSKRLYLDYSDAFAKETLDKFVALRPEAVEDLQECIEVYNSILQNSADVVVSETQVQNLLKGLFRRIAQHESFTSKKFLDLDPIKIDFVFREAFRMTLYHDCTVLVRKRQIRFEDAPEPIPTESEDDLARSADESWNVVEPKAEEDRVVEDRAEQDVAPVIEDRVVVDRAIEERAEQNAVPERVIEDRAEKGPSPPASVAGSVVSRAMSAITSVTQLKKPRVRTVILSNDDDNHSRFTKQSRNN